jgi:hypothetical protein
LVARRITKKDLETLAGYINEEKSRREKNEYRKQHEAIWTEVDRQIQMKAESSKFNSNDPQEQWESSIELGSLADASEIIADDVMRIAFPSDRDWFKPHVNLSDRLSIDPETGDREFDITRQKTVDGVYKSLLSQQHSDFGLKARVKLSVKEALHHGSFVAVAKWASQKMFYGGGRSKEIGAPIWRPYSMWQCFPDDSPEVIGTNITYDGSMIIQEEVPISTILNSKAFINRDKIKEQNDKEKKNHVKILTWYGDVYIKRSSGDDIWVPNYKVILCGDYVIYYEENELPHSPVIFAGYEKDDVRDPYYSSPLIKRSPTHKLATHCANKYVEAIDLRTFPPLAYDANEPTFKATGGPIIAPKEAYGVRAGGQIKPIEVADPTWALQGLQMFKQEVEEGTGVNAVRKGASASVEQTAFEIQKLDQKSEIRTIDFVATLESQALKPFLYMQHELNKKKLETYQFYNTQLNTPDFVTATKSDIQDFAKECHFEVVGSKGVLGEERRRQGMLEVTGFFGSNPLFAPLLNTEEIMMDAYKDVGVKDPERYLNLNEQMDPQVQAQMEQMQAALQELSQKLQETELKAAQIPLIQKDYEAQLSELNVQIGSMKAENKLLEEQIQTTTKQAQFEIKMAKEANAVTSTVSQVQQKASDNTKAEVQAIKQGMDKLVKFLVEREKEKDERNQKIKAFIMKRGSDEAKEIAREI